MLRAVPDHADAHRLRIGVLLMLKRDDDVITSCDAVLKVRPTAEVFEIRGLAKDRRKDFSGAIDDYTQALAQRPDQPGLWNRRGWAHLVTNAVQLALEDFDRAIRLDGSNGDALSGRARCASCWASIAPRSPMPRNPSATVNRALGCTISRAGLLRGPLRPRRARSARRVARPWR